MKAGGRSVRVRWCVSMWRGVQDRCAGCHVTSHPAPQGAPSPSLLGTLLPDLAFALSARV